LREVVGASARSALAWLVVGLALIIGAEAVLEAMQALVQKLLDLRELLGIGLRDR
jgi:hypothetical protein